MSTTATEQGERLARIVPEALAAIHEVLERHRVTEEEWHAVLAFLGDVGRADEFILLSDVTRTSVLIDAMSHAADESATASDVEGPLYVEDPPWREAPVKIYEEYEGSDAGEVLFVRGTVTSTDGTPLPDAVIDIWQTGPTGGYDIWDERQPEFNFRGRFGVAESGGVRVPDHGPEAVHGADRRAGRPLPRRGRPAPVAPGAHPLQGDRRRPRAARHAGLLPRRPVPRERHDRRREGRARPAAWSATTAASAGSTRRSRPATSTSGCARRTDPVRFASCSLGDRRFAGLVDGDVVRPLRDVAELGAGTPSELLADPPVGDEEIPLADVRIRPVVPRPGQDRLHGPQLPRARGRGRLRPAGLSPCCSRSSPRRSWRRATRSCSRPSRRPPTTRPSSRS